MKKRCLLSAGVASALALTLAPISVLAQSIKIDPAAQDIRRMQQRMPNKLIPIDAAVKGVWLELPAMSPLAPTIGGQVAGDSWPINAIHMAVLPSGKVLTYGSRGDVYATGVDGQDGSQNVLWHPDTWEFDRYEVKDYLGKTQLVPWQNYSDRPNYAPWEARSKFNSFCSGATIMPNGKLLMVGGSGGVYIVGDATDASRMTGTYDYISKQTNRVADNMAIGGRWYPTVITTADGRQLLVGGLEPYAEDLMDYDLKSPGLSYLNTVRAPMVYKDGEGWSSLPNISLSQASKYFELYQSRAEFPRAWVAPGGDIFGISTDRMWFLNPKNGGELGDAGNGVFNKQTMVLNDWYVDPKTNTWKQYTDAELPNVGSGASSAVMYSKGLVMQVGGNGYWVLDGSRASSKATIVDIRNGARSAVTYNDAALVMKQPRKFFNTTVLPNGNVFVNGGTTQWEALGYQHVLAAEMFIPEDVNAARPTGRFVSMAAQKYPRGYHGTASLLPNGTVLSAGAGNPYTVYRKGEVFIPPYFFKSDGKGGATWSDGPLIQDVSSLRVNNGPVDSPYTITLPDTSRRNLIKDVVLVGLSSVTHGFNTGQRRIPLERADWTVSSVNNQTQINISAFPTSDLTPPGYYMMFLINQDGTPSRGVIIGIGAVTSVPRSS